MKEQKTFLDYMLDEVSSYDSIERIEELLEGDKSLAFVPVQPLYMAYRKLPREKQSLYLDKLSEDQKQSFLDIDLWHKDEIAPEQFIGWLEVYARSNNEKIRFDFAKSEDFGLFMKGRFNIWTFDFEDPMYPDHDNYFLTEDNQLLFELDENFEHLDELKQLIKDLYSELGVEKAYAHLFKIVSDSFLNMQEEAYHFKKGRMQDLGMIDYLDALRVDNCFPNKQFMDNWIKKKEKEGANIQVYSKLQILHKQALTPYKKNFDSIADELLKLDDEKRQEYLRFNFIRLVNSSIELSGSLRDGTIALNRVSEKNKCFLNLGIRYISQTVGEFGSKGIFEKFDFTEVYKVGHSLVKSERIKLKKAIEVLGDNDQTEAFVGDYFSDLFSLSFEDAPRYRLSEEEKAKQINSLELLNVWQDDISLFSNLVPFMKSMQTTFDSLKESGQLQDSFYANYDVRDIDFEAILLSAFVNHGLENYESANEKKLGLSPNEIVLFLEKYFDEEGKLVNKEVIENDINDFAKSFGLEIVGSKVDLYIFKLVEKHLAGYEKEELKLENMRHIGGPIILNIN